MHHYICITVADPFHPDTILPCDTEDEIEEAAAYLSDNDLPAQPVLTGDAGEAVETGLVVEPAAALRTYVLRDETSGVEVSISAADDADAREQAEKWAREGDWNNEGGTVWVDVMVIDDDGDHEVVNVAIDPDEPECSSEEHDWQDRGVRGTGGGVIITEECAHCGLRRIRDTWAQRADTGEQGLESVRYAV